MTSRIDLYRPVPPPRLVRSPQDLGRAAYHLLSRGVAPTIVGALLFDIRFPAGAAGVGGLLRSASPLAVLVSFAIRFLVAMLGVLAARRTGPSTLAFVLAAVFFSGLTVPLVLFPGWSRDVVLALPWATYLQVPADLWLGKREGWEACRRARAPGARWAARAAAARAAWCCAGRPSARWWCRVAEARSIAVSVRGYRRHRVDVDPRRDGLPHVVLDDGGQRLRWCGALDFVGIWIMFHNVDALGGFEPLGDRLPLRRHGVRPRGRGPGRRPDRAARPDDPASGASTR